MAWKIFHGSKEEDGASVYLDWLGRLSNLPEYLVKGEMMKWGWVWSMKILSCWTSYTSLRYNYIPISICISSYKIRVRTVIIT